MNELDFSAPQISYQTVYPTSWNVNVEKNLSEIRKQLSQIVKEELPKDQPRHIFILGRKANLLFNSIEHNIDKIHQISIVRTYQQFIRIQIKKRSSSKDLPNIAIILTDSVRKGNETTQFVNYLKKRQIRAEKICGYLSNRYGKTKLKKKFPHIKLRFRYNTRTIVKYKEVYDRLNPIYQSSPEPLESDIPYRLYIIKPRLKNKEVENLLKETSKQLFKSKKNHSEYQDYELCVKNVNSYSIDINDANLLLSSLPFSEELETVDSISFRIRYFKELSIIRVKVLCYYHFKQFPKIEDMGICPNKKNKFCKVFKASSKTKNFMCLQCKDHRISMFLINKIGLLIRKYAIKHGFELSKSDTYSIIRIFGSND
jgi:hypothetical protein